MWPLVVVVVCCLLYLNLHGFPEPVCRFVRDQFRQKGYAVQFRDLRLDWFNGILARDLVLADDKRPGQILAQINEVSLQINWPQLWSGVNVIGGLRIANASISVPVPPDEVGVEHFTASDAYAHLRFEENGVIKIEQLTGMYCGVYLFVTGRIRLRTQAVERLPTPKEQEQRLRLVSKGLRELHSLRCRKPLDLYVDFNIDLDNPMAMSARVRLHGKEVRYRRLLIDSFGMDVAMGEGALHIFEGEAGLAGGAVSVRGDYDIGGGRVDLSLKSTIDPLALRRFLPDAVEKELQSLRLSQNPKIELRYRLSPETGTIPVLSGKVETGGLEFRTVEFRAIAVSFENRGPEIKVSDAKIVMPRGELTGHGKYHIESSDFEYELDSTLDPTKLLPLMTPLMKRWVSPSAFIDLPHVIAKVRGDFVDPDAFAYDAEVTTGQGSYRGVLLEEASGRLRLRRNRLEASNLVLKRQDGELAGELTADFDQQQLTFNMRTTANPVPMAGLLGENAVKMLEPYRFGPELSASAKGFVDFARPERVTWTADVDNKDFGWWKLIAERGRGHLAFTNNMCRVLLDTEGVAYGTNRAERAAADLLIRTGVVKAKDIVVTIGGGKVQGDATTDVSRQRVDFQFQSTADPHALAALLGPAASKKLEAYRFGSNTVSRATGIADLLNSNQTTWVAHLATDEFGYGKFNADHVDANLALTNEVLRIQARAKGLQWWTIKADQVDADLTLTNEALHVQARTQALQWWKLKTDQGSADILASNGSVTIRNANASICGGTLRGQADLRAVGTNTAFRLHLDTDQCDIKKLLQTMGSANTNASGRLKTKLELAGIGTDLMTYEGGGTLEIADGVLLEVPLFGIFSRILNLVVPGLGSASVTKANCAYTITNQLVKTEDLQIETGAAAVHSHGAVGFPKGDLDFRVEAQPLRSWPGINILTWMFQKIFEYKVGGTIDNPNWRPTRLPKELLPHSEGKPSEPKPDNP